MGRVIRVYIMGKEETKDVTVEEAHRILNDTYNDPVGGLVVDARTGKVIRQIGPNVEGIVIMKQLLVDI